MFPVILAIFLSVSFTLILAIIATKSSAAKIDKVFPYKNPDLPVDERVSDILSRMTLEEKVAQTLYASGWTNRKCCWKGIGILILKRQRQVSQTVMAGTGGTTQ